MGLEELLRKGQIGRIRKDSRLVEKTLRLAERDLKTAKDNLKDKNYDWALAIAYNAMLQAGRALMFHCGYKPKGEFKHVSVVKFAKAISSKCITEDGVAVLDRMRRKRHQAVYDLPQVVSRAEAKEALALAEEFVSSIKTAIKG
jgi:uncharacterized protein (UPF0332 family)